MLSLNSDAGTLHAAAIEVFLDRPYPEFTFEAIADRAGVPVSDLTGRWQCPAELIIDVLAEAAGPTLSDPGRVDGLRSELLYIASSLANLFASQGDLMLTVLRRVGEHPDLDLAFRERYLLPRLDCSRKMFGMAVLREQLKPGANVGLVLSLAPALLTYRGLLGHSTPDEHFAEHFVDSVMLPLLMRT